MSFSAEKAWRVLKKAPARAMRSGQRREGGYSGASPAGGAWHIVCLEGVRQDEKTRNGTVFKEKAFNSLRVFVEKDNLLLTKYAGEARPRKAARPQKRTSSPATVGKD